MSRLRDSAVRVVNLFRRERIERELDAELRAYLELEVDENIRRGMAPQEARRAALARLGGVETVKEECRDGLPMGTLTWAHGLTDRTGLTARLLPRRHGARVARSPEATCAFSALAGLLMFCWAAPATAQSPTGEGRSGWYVGVGGGANWAPDINQRGSNRDTLCYPSYACFDEDPRSEQSGYRWAYDLAAGAGAPFELATGFMLRRARLELSFGQRMNGIEQMFRSVSDFAGNPLVRRRGNPVTSDAEYWIDNLTVRALAFNAYYDFGRDANRPFSPFVGVGIGPAFAEVRGLH